MTTETNTLPLWKELNEKRTQGEWKVNNKSANSGCRIIDKLDRDVLDCYSFASFIPIEEAKSNTQYTALAVNNFAQVCEALEDLLEHCKFIPKETFTEDGKAHFQYTLNKAKQVLNNIK